MSLHVSEGSVSLNCICDSYIYSWSSTYLYVGIMAHYWNDDYTIGIVAILLKMWLTIGMVAILLEWWLYY